MMERSQSLAPDGKSSEIIDPYIRTEPRLNTEHHNQAYKRAVSELRSRKDYQSIPRNAPAIVSQRSEDKVNNISPKNGSSTSTSSANTTPASTQYGHGETRGRQYQIPMRYEFQKNIVHTNSSSQGPPIAKNQRLTNASQQRQPPLNNNSNIFPADYTVNKVSTRESSLHSEQDLRRRVHSPFMHTRKTNSSNALNSNNHSTYAEFKRHSISGAVEGNTIISRDYSSDQHKKALINAYNDSKVFDTVVPPRSISRKSIANIRYSISSNNLLNINGNNNHTNSNAHETPLTSTNVSIGEKGEHGSSVTSEKSLVSMNKKGVSINKPALRPVQSFASSISKINYYNNENNVDDTSDKNIYHFISEYQMQQQTQMPLQRIRSSLQLQSNNNNEHNGKRIKSKMDIIRASRTASVDYSSKSSSSEDDNEHESDSDNDNDADTELEIPSDVDDNNSLSTKRTTLSDISTGAYDYSSNIGADRMPMRTQQRQLAIKDLTMERKTGVSAWLELANDNSSNTLQQGGGDTIIDIAKQNERQLQNNDQLGIKSSTTIYADRDHENEQLNRHTWSKVSIQERNTYEKISNDLRKLALFNKRPMKDSLERYAKYHNSNIQSGLSIGKRTELVKEGMNGRGATEEQRNHLQKTASYIDDATGTFKLGAGRELAAMIWAGASTRLLFHPSGHE